MAKAQSLSVQTLIVIALGIVVLITSILIYNSVSDPAREGIKMCENQGGVCRTTNCESGELRNVAGECPGEQLCCFRGTIE